MDRVDYGAGWSYALNEEGGFTLTSLGGDDADAVIVRELPNPNVIVEDAPAGAKIVVNGSNAIVVQP